MPQVSSEWLCVRCKKKWTSLIKYEGEEADLKPGEEDETKPAKYESVSCPGCGNPFLQLYKAGWRNVRIEVLPRP